MRSKGCAEVALQAGDLAAGTGLQVKHVHYRGEKELKLRLGHIVAKAHSLSGPEGQKVLRFEKFTLGVQKALGVELLGLSPEVRRHVERVEVGDDVAVGRNGEPFHNNRAETEKNI